MSRYYEKLPENFHQMSDEEIQTWVENINLGLIKEINRIDYMHGRGMSWGKYVFQR
jgi:hypothetical protein